MEKLETDVQALNYYSYNNLSHSGDNYNNFRPVVADAPNYVPPDRNGDDYEGEQQVKSQLETIRNGLSEAKRVGTAFVDQIGQMKDAAEEWRRNRAEKAVEKSKRHAKAESSWCRQFNDFMRDTTFHGVRNVFDSSRRCPIRCVWFFACITCQTMLGILAYMYVTTFIAQPTSTSIYINTDNWNLTFPAVTICNLNLHTKQELAKQPEFAAYLKSKHERLIIGHDDGKRYNFSGFNYTEFLLTSHPDISGEPYDQSLIDQMSGYECSWRNIPCSLADLTRVVTEKGVCFTFNAAFDKHSNRSKVVQGLGPEEGLTLRLWTGHEDYTLNDLGILSSGFRVYVHDSKIWPVTTEEGILLSPGFEHNIGIAEEQHVSNTSAGCRWPFNKAPRLMWYGKYGGYSMDLCYLECKTAFVILRCKCKAHYMRYPDDVPFCDFQQYRTCVFRSIGAFWEEGYFNNCSPPCLPGCEETKYTYTLSASYYPGQQFVNFVAEIYNITGNGSIGIMTTEEFNELLRRNALIIRVFYETMSITVMHNDYAYDMKDFSSDIGGAMGLLAGASILSILEIFDCLCICCCRKFNKVSGTK